MRDSIHYSLHNLFGIFQLINVKQSHEKLFIKPTMDFKQQKIHLTSAYYLIMNEDGALQSD